MSTALIVFAKAPVAGWAKTRLAPALGADGAAALAARLLEHAVQAAVDAAVGEVELCVTPDGGHPAFDALVQRHGVALTAQGEGDLGARMDRALQRALSTHRRALLIGTDAPALDATMLRTAAAALERHDAVFVPALDGGYALVGLSRPAPALFEGIAWSTPQVMTDTRDRGRAAALRMAELPPVADIDEPADLEHLPPGWLPSPPAAPGRSCPLHYRYSPSVFAAPPSPGLDGLELLYVVGGLYGNELALQQVLRLFERERGRKALVFNGDFHWFDADAAAFERVQRGVLAHAALRGNVETEIASGDDAGDAGCGCAYPDWVDDAVVERSNRILQRLRGAASAEQRRELAALPMVLRADVGALRLGLVHGDAQSLAGWGFAQEHLRDAAHRECVRSWFDEARVGAFASTHTCLPVFQRLRAADGGARWIFNNGAAGMPNFAGDAAGLLTRVALAPYAGPERRFGVRAGEAFVDGLAVEVDAAAWRACFLQRWPPGSDAHASYLARIERGPAYRVEEVVRVDG